LLCTRKPLDGGHVANIIVNNAVIPYSTTGKYLGVMLDDRLTFAGHIDLVCSKVSRAVGVLYRLSHFVPKNILLSLYYSLVFPYLLYCNIVWGGACNSSLTKLFLLQKRVVRILTCSGYLDHTNPLFFSTSILKIFDVYKFNLSVYTYSNISMFPTAQHVYGTRNRNNLVPAHQRLSSTQRSLSYACPKIFNEIPLNIREARTIKEFRRRLRDSLVEGYA